jgi:uncharacterized protein (TIGR03437 family)
MPSRASFAFALAVGLPGFGVAGSAAYSRILSPGSQFGTITAMAVDGAGNVYLTGAVSAADFPTTPGVQPAFGGGACGGGLAPLGGPTYACTDAFVTKLDPLGNIVFSTFFGGNGLDYGSSIAVDLSGNVYVAGVTSPNTNGSPGSPFKTTAGAAYTQRAGAPSDGFVIKLDPRGATLLYSTLIPGMNNASITVDVSGSVYFAGSPVSAAFATVHATNGAYQTSNDGSFIGKLAPDGSAFLYATYFGHQSTTMIASIAIDPTGNAYVAGTTNSNGFPATSGAFQSNPPGPRSAFVAELNQTGTALVYASFLGGSQSDSGLQVRVDSLGQAVVLGIANSTDFPMMNAFQSSFVPPSWAPSNNTFVQRFITKLSADGSHALFSTFFPDANAIDIDPAGNIYVAGLAGSGFPVPAGALQPCFAGGRSDVLLAQLSNAGALTAATYFGGSGIDGPGLVPAGLVFQSAVQAIAVGADGFVYTAGGTNSTDFPSTAGGAVTALSNFSAKLKIADPTQNTTSSCLSLAISNGASFAEGPIAPGELITLRGTGLGPATATIGLPGPDGLLPTQLNGVQVTFDGVPAPILYAQAQQVNVQAPFELLQSSTKIQVSYNTVTTNPTTVAVQSAAPAIFHVDPTSSQGAILNQDNTSNSPSNPAPRGSYVSVYGTGGGLTSPAVVTGGYAPPAQNVFLQPTLVLLGPIPQIQANVVYAGSAPTLQSGVFQLVFQIPANAPSGNVQINITMGHFASTDSVLGTTIAIQ